MTNTSRENDDAARCKPIFDRALVAKYDCPGPRYTSYPTAPHFSRAFGPADYASLLGASRDSGRALSIYVHIPFCQFRCYFCGCNTTISSRRERAVDYLSTLRVEIAQVASQLGGRNREVVQIHWGGGTPTYLSASQISELMTTLRGHFHLADGCEISVEVDPRDCDEQRLDALQRAGVNRLSLGVQDLDDKVQQLIGRTQPLEITEQTLSIARSKGIARSSIDLIYGLPGQTPQSFGHTLTEIVRLNPDRLAVFNFAYLPELFRHQRVIDPKALPSPQTKLQILEETNATLAAAGYRFIGMDHFAKPNDPLAIALADGTLTRNFQGYSTCADTDLVALGSSAISAVAGGYAQNEKKVSNYSRAIGEARLATCRGRVLSDEDRLRRELIMSVMSNFVVCKRAFEAAYQIAFDQHFASELEALAPMEADGLIERHADRLEITATGRLLVRNIAMVFDAYLSQGRSPRYSRTL